VREAALVAAHVGEEQRVVAAAAVARPAGEAEAGDGLGGERDLAARVDDAGVVDAGGGGVHRLRDDHAAGAGDVALDEVAGDVGGGAGDAVVDAAEDEGGLAAGALGVAAPAGEAGAGDGRRGER